MGISEIILWLFFFAFLGMMFMPSNAIKKSIEKDDTHKRYLDEIKKSIRSRPAYIVFLSSWLC